MAEKTLAAGMLLLFLSVVVLISAAVIVRHKRAKGGKENFAPDWESTWTLALVHSEQCPHCAVARTAYKQVADNLHRSGKLETCKLEVLDPELTEASVIARDTLEKLGNPSYVPHLVLRSPGGQLMVYSGQYSYDSIVRWIVSYGPNCSLGSSLYNSS